MWKVEPTGFPKVLEVGYERQAQTMDDSMVFWKRTRERMKMLCTEMEEVADGADLGGRKIKSSLLTCLNLGWLSLGFR